MLRAANQEAIANKVYAEKTLVIKMKVMVELPWSWHEAVDR